MNQASLAAALSQAGLLSGKSSPPVEERVDRPWFIGLLLGASGWLAGIFLMAVAGMLITPDSAMGWLTVCVLCFAAAFALYKIDKENAFFDQLALALWFAGQIAFMLFVVELTETKIIVFGAVTILQGVLAFTTPNRFAKTVATLFACIAWSMTVRFGIWDDTDAWDRKERVPLFHAFTGWFVTWVPVMALTLRLIATERVWLAGGRQQLARPALSGLLVALSFGPLASQPQTLLFDWSDTASSFTNWFAVWPLLAVGVALFAFFSAHRLRHRALMGAAIAGALLHLAQFYYVLGISLLMKSAIMVVVGALLLAGAIILKKREAA